MYITENYDVDALKENGVLYALCIACNVRVNAPFYTDVKRKRHCRDRLEHHLITLKRKNEKQIQKR